MTVKELIEALKEYDETWQVETAYFLNSTESRKITDMRAHDESNLLIIEYGNV